jgi:MFS family permease
VQQEDELEEADGLWSPRHRALTGGLVLTITLVAFESLAVATILPDVEDDLGGLGLYGWVFSAFFLGSLVGVVVAGQTTDRRGPAAAYLLGLGLFVAGLVAGGLAPSMLVLVVARFVQGLGAGVVLAGLSADTVLLAVPLVVAGVVIGTRPLLGLVPAGTMRAAPGLPAAVAVRGILTFAFFGADAYLPLAITDARGSTTLVAGLTLTASALAWTAGSWTQERFVQRVGADRFVSVGHAVLLVGIALAGLALWDAVPLAVFVGAWTVAGFGIGMAYSPISLVVLSEAPAGQEGAASAAMQLTDLLGVALGTGAGGAAVGLGDVLGWTPEVGIGIAWVVAAIAAVLGIAVGRRLPQHSGTGGRSSSDPGDAVSSAT